MIRVSGMSIDSLMTWLLKHSSPMVDLCGPARTTMEMYNLMLLPRVCNIEIVINVMERRFRGIHYRGI